MAWPFSSVVIVPLQFVLYIQGATSFSTNAAWNSTVREQGVVGAVLLQWRNPTDVLSILLVVGGDVVQKALAQLSGGRLVPVAFSFGWVTYSLGALLSAVGDCRLMPSTPDCPSILVNTEAGYSRTNTSWMLGRILRDLEQRTPQGTHGLCITIYRAMPTTGTVRHDWVWYSGFVVITLQLAVAAIPWAWRGNWLILLATACGTLLALSGGALPQWRAEKWACRPNSPETYCLLRGNGHQQVIVIESAGMGLNLEDLASSRVPGLPFHRLLTTILAALWTVFLVTVAGLREDTWYLLAVGCMGMVQNIVAAGAARDPSVFGMALKHIGVVKGNKVMQVLMQTEELHPRVGASLVPILFPGRLRESERAFWDSKLMRVRAKPEIFLSANQQQVKNCQLENAAASSLTEEQAAVENIKLAAGTRIEEANATEDPTAASKAVKPLRRLSV
ncbi:MAG: hypothetical protein Q9176_006664 [Flavoplaca citrina]